eukprot:tig00000826_g4599.t1
MKQAAAAAKAGSIANTTSLLKTNSVLGKIQAAVAKLKPKPADDPYKGLEPYFSVQNTRASSYFIEIGWLFPAFSMLDDDVVGYRVLVKAMNPDDPKKQLKEWTAHVPGSPIDVTEAFYNSAQKLTLASLSALGPNATMTEGNITVDPLVCEKMKAILIWDTALRRGYCRRIRGKINGIVPGTFLAGTVRTVDMQNMFSYKLENLNPESPYKIRVLADRIDGKGVFLGGNGWDGDLWTFRECQCTAAPTHTCTHHNAKP